jgi:hypothetical protein
MATTVNAGFAGLRTNIEITNKQTAKVALSHKALRSAIAASLPVVADFLAGSYARDTLIAPLSEADIDVFVVLNNNAFGPYRSDPGALLRDIQTILRSRYTRTKGINADGQAVTVGFDAFSVDIVPAFSREAGGYFIPDAQRGAWIETDPTKHAQVMTTHNRLHNGYLVPAVKMMKAWNRGRGEVLRGFYLELLTLHALSQERISSFQEAVGMVLARGIESVRYSIKDPFDAGGRVQGLKSAKTVNEAVALFRRDSETAVLASLSEAMNRQASAYGYWQKIFGEYFPAYG